MAMCLTLQPRYQRLKTNRRRKQQRRNQHQEATRTDSSGVIPDDRQPDASRSLSAGYMAKRTEIGNSSSRSMPPKRTVCYQQREWQQAHSRKRLPCTFWGCGNRTALALRLTTDEEAILSKLLLVRRSIGNSKRVGQRCVGQPEELRSEDQITRENPGLPLCERRIRAMEDGVAFNNRQSRQRRPSDGSICFGP